MFKHLWKLVLLALILAACGPEGPQQPEPVPPTEAAADVEEEVAEEESAEVEEAPEKISEFDNATAELVVPEGESFQYWNFSRQEWLTFKIKRAQPLKIDLPLWMKGRSYLDNAHWFYSDSGFGELFHFSVEEGDGSVTVSTGQFKRLRLVNNDDSA